MPTLIDLRSINQNYTNLGFSGLDYDVNGVVENGGNLSYGTSAFDIELFGTGLAFGAGATPITGTVNVMQLAIDGNEALPEIVIRGYDTSNGFANALGLDATTFITNGLTDQEESTYFWRGLIGGSDDWYVIDAANTYVFDLLGDFDVVGVDEFLVGGDDIFADRSAVGGEFVATAGFSGGQSDLFGDANSVEGTLVGGDDLFHGGYDEIYGDVFSVSGTLLGGNDVFIQVGETDSRNEFHGDADNNNGTLIGGNDTMVGDVSVTGSHAFYGDARSSNGTEAILRGGDDNITGSGGNDTIIGDASSVDGGFAVGGADELNGGAGDDVIFGDFQFISNGTDVQGGNDVIRGQEGNDFLYGNGGQDRIDGGIGDDLIDGGEGDDVAFGSFGVDNISGGDGNDLLRGNNGDDVMFGGDGDDFMAGGIGRDEMDGGIGNDTIDGGGGFDVLNGGEGDDILTGGFNADDFVFSGDFGNDTITDFAALSGAEDIDLSGVATITDFADLQNNHLTQDGNGDAVIFDGLGNTITLIGVDILDLDAGDFIF